MTCNSGSYARSAVSSACGRLPFAFRHLGLVCSLALFLCAFSACSTHTAGPSADAAKTESGHPECAACADPFPRCIGVKDAWFCVGCVSDADCAENNRGVCLKPSYMCSGAGTLPAECAVCTGATPSCVYMDKTWYCAGCVTDGDCADKKQGYCMPGVLACSMAPSGCMTDGDCHNVGASAFDLACDVTRHQCYDTGGRCDNVSAFCREDEWSNCQLPSTATGTTAPMGRCTCGRAPGPSSNPACAIASPACDCFKDAADPACHPNGGDCCAFAKPIAPSCAAPVPATSAPTGCYGSLNCGCDLPALASGTTASLTGFCGL